MKISYPLSLKVSLWLMLNLLLLAGVGVGFFVMHGGVRWDALVVGPSGERLQALANVIVGEAAVTTGEARSAVLKRFSTAYHVDFFLIGFDDTVVAGGPVELPPEVRTRVEQRPPWMNGAFGGRRGGRGEFDGRGRRDFGEKGPRDPAEKAPPREGRDVFEKNPRNFGGNGAPDTEPGRREPPPPVANPPPEARPGRFVVRAGTPAAYWAGIRVPFAAGERPRPAPGLLLVRVSSLWGLLHLLNLQSWVLAGTAVIALSVLFWLPLVRSITHSLGQLTRATEEIAEGHFDARVNTGRRDELGKLGESVNRMAARLDAHMTGQKRFLGDVAHELCSPLARLQMATGILSEQAPAALQETVSDVREEVQQMSTLVNELLAFTKAGLRPRDVQTTALALAPLAAEVLARENATDRVTLSIPEELRVMAEPDLLGRALGNLVRNAVRYAGDTGSITLTATRNGGAVTIAVEDEGPGVPAADLDRLGEPFFRPELARTRESGGVGLGLAIVRNSVAACGGKVTFANRAPHGFRAELELPAA